MKFKATSGALNISEHRRKSLHCNVVLQQITATAGKTLNNLPGSELNVHTCSRDWKFLTTDKNNNTGFTAVFT